VRGEVAQERLDVRGKSRRHFLGLAAGAAGAALAAAPLRAEAPQPAPGATGWIAAVTRIHGIPGREEELKQHLLSLAEPTRSEPGCVVYDLYQDPAARHEFVRFEIWTSAEALEAHKRTPHLRTSFEKRQREGWTTEISVWERVPG
jgi:quinol monooxygenase YgiN